MKVWLIWGSSGEYSDAASWVASVWDSEEKALEALTRLRDTHQKCLELPLAKQHEEEEQKWRERQRSRPYYSQEPWPQHFNARYDQIATLRAMLMREDGVDEQLGDFWREDVAYSIEEREVR